MWKEGVCTSPLEGLLDDSSTVNKISRDAIVLTDYLIFSVLETPGKSEASAIFLMEDILSLSPLEPVSMSLIS
jgi:hypothetical protein